MKLSEIGEFGFIQILQSQFNQNLPKNVVGIGDDCAILPYRDNLSLLVTTDLLIENIHFIRSQITPHDLGYKSLAVNISDIAAMGGKPTYALLSVALPSNMDLAWCRDFIDGLQDIAKKEGVQIVGGDTTKSESDIVINIAVLGEMETVKIKRRSHAQMGDLICCTGYLGDSAGGLKVLLERLPWTNSTIPLIKQHQLPRPHVKEGLWLAEKRSVHAMIDVSDGIDSDIHRMMEQSHCGAQIELDKLPLSPSLVEVGKQFEWDIYELAATGGEDYCLLFTVAPEDYKQLAKEYEKNFKHKPYLIGTILEGKELVYLHQGQKTEFSGKGFDHFQKKS